MKIWDCRQQQPVGGFNLGYKVFASDLNGTVLAMGLSDEKVLLADLNNLQALQKPEYIDSPLGHLPSLLASASSLKGMGSVSLLSMAELTFLI